MRRLNVQFTQIEECIRTSLFAVDALPRNPPLERGEELLLQLVKSDAGRLGKLDSRIEFALVFDHAEEDPSGRLSHQHWPKAGKIWRYILHCSETVPTIPFSLEKLKLSQDYGGQTNPMYIEPADAAMIRPYIKGRVAASELQGWVSPHELLSSIRAHDRIVQHGPVRTTRVREHERRLTDPWLGDALKLLYDHRCQICRHDFRPRYGVPFADVRFLTAPADGGEPVSRNLLVVCPNHDAIIDAAGARFDDRVLAFRFPDGLVEKVDLRDHLLN
jgi:hypothetical protein